MNVLRYIGVYFSKPIWSFIRSCAFWLFRLNKIGQVKKEMEATKGLKIETLMNLFKWQDDVVGDWTPWVSTVIAKDLQDDCDGAAALAKWWFKQHGIKADILNLYNSKEGHTVCVAEGIMVSNGNVIKMNTDRDSVLKYFNGEYDTVI